MANDDEDHYEATADSGSDESFVKPNKESIYRRSLARLETDVSRSKRHVVPDSSTPPKHPAWYTKEGIQAYETSLKNMTGLQWLETLVPLTRSIQKYNLKRDLPKDFIAGCTVGFMIIPQSLSYAKLAGLPVQYGLYSSLVPIYAYAFFGTSRQLAVGPVALVSLTVANGIGKLLSKQGISSSDKKVYAAAYVAAAIQTSFLVGVLYLILGILRLGFITVLLSHAVVSGFISASAIIIGCSQIKYFFGYSIAQTEILDHIFQELVKGIHQFNWRPFLVGIFALALLIFMKNIGKYVPQLNYLRVLGPLTVTIIGIILDVIVNFPKHDIPVVGTIPKGLPDSTIHYWTPLHGFDQLIPVVLSVALVGFMESISIAKKLAAFHKYSINPSSEFVGLGMANFLGSMTGAYPVTGSFSRSAVNNDTGAQTAVSSFFTATIVLFVLLFLTPIFERVVRSSCVAEWQVFNSISHLAFFC
jgi:sulfate transporter 4